MVMTYTGGRLAREAGVHVETVRYYERIGLLSPKGQQPSGYRDYTSDDLARLRAIVELKRYGFTLKEISELLETCSDAGATCGDLQERFLTKLTELREEISALEARCATIERAMSWCDPTTDVQDCEARKLVEIDAKVAVDESVESKDTNP